MKKDILEKLKDHERTSRAEAESTIFQGQTREDVLGRLPDDPATERQKRYLFVLGRDLGLSGKTEIKEAYGIDSISSLTIEGAGEVIDQMHLDLGIPLEKRERAPKEKESSGVWHRKSGVNYIGETFAKCGQCVHFTGGLATDGKCKKEVRKGVFKGKKIHPMTKDCFEYTGGELKANIEVWPEKEEAEEDLPF